ncbi:MAG: glycosyltransferase family 2 protein [Calothrix sp. MO_192.B10]|nr:glycosyltransferase family 2 protein [Calothrix sp. MO_192.B10]
MIILSQQDDADSPDVSVITPTYNRISMLEEAIACVFSQDFDGVVEIIVVDDNSSDRTSEIVSQKYPNIRLISLKQNVGAYVARNIALKEAKGKYIAFLDSDDLWEKDYLKTQLAALEANERCFCVSTLVIWNTLKNRKEIYLQKPDLKRYTSSFHQLLVANSFIYTPSSVVFPRQVFSEVGLFDETYKISGDKEFYIRCLLAGYSLIFTELPNSIVRIHNQGRATNFKNFDTRMKIQFAIADKFYPLVERRVDIAPIKHMYAEIYAYCASKYCREKYFIKWLYLSIESARYANFVYALSNMIKDIRCLLRIGTKMRLINSYFQKITPI